MFVIKVVLLVGLLGFSWGSTNDPFVPCSGTDDPSVFTVTTVHTHNVHLHYQVMGELSSTITKATQSIQVKREFAGIIVEVEDSVEDLCEYLACPISPGGIMLEWGRNHEIYPKGEYYVTLRLENEELGELMCINLVTEVTQVL